MTAISIVGVVLWSQPAPQKIPALDAIISEDSGNNLIHLYHDGGDLIAAGDIKILVDGNDYTAGFKKAGVSGWSTWATGESLDYTYSGTTAPALVQIIYTHTGASSVLAVSQFADFASGGSTGGSTNTTPTRTITATAGTGGTITPLGQVIVPVGSSQSFTIAPDSGYTIAGVIVDGVSQGAITGYTFTNVLSDHTISATFIAPLVANFDWQSTHVVSGYYWCSFWDTSTVGPTSWSWSFGDTQTSTNQNPVPHYYKKGTYSVTLTVTRSSDGATSSVTKSVTFAQ
jgi:hypothetical protein